MEALGEASAYDLKTGGDSFGGTELTHAYAIEEQTIAVLLIDVLKRLGGASQERSAARIIFVP